MDNNQIINTIKRQHNPDRDIGPGPRVTHTDHQLLRLIQSQQKKIEALEMALRALQARVNALDEFSNERRL